MSYDQVLEHLGEFGKYQKKIFFLLCLPAISCGFHKLASVFLQARPDFRCRLPHEGENALFSDILFSDYQHYYPRDDHTNKFSQCRRYLNTTISGQGGGIGGGGEGGGIETIKCDSWIYDMSEYTDSVMTEFDLVCDKSYLRSTADSVFMLGVLLGSIIFGVFSDKYGRKIAFVVTIVLMVISGALVCFAPEYFSYIFLRAVVGSTASGIFICAFCLGVELVGAKKRMLAGCLVQCFFSFGYIFLAVLAYLIRSWRYLQGVISFSAVFFLGYWWLVPESNRWLISQGRTDEARKNILLAAKANGKTIPPELLEKAIRKPEEDGNNQQLRGPSPNSFFSVLRYPNLRNKLINIFYCWFANSVAYYGLSWNTSNLGGNDYVNFFISGVVEIPGYILILLTINRYGRKPTFCGSMLFGGIVLILTSIVPEDYQWAIIILAMLGKFGVTASYGTIYIFSAEQFPTLIRSVCLGVASMFARIGGILSPHITLLSDFWTPLPLIVLGVLVLLGGFTGLFLPETLNKQLPDTIEQGEMFGKLVKGKLTYLEDVPLKKEKRKNQDCEDGRRVGESDEE